MLIGSETKEGTCLYAVIIHHEITNSRMVSLTNFGQILLEKQLG